ncbi:MAG: hypothetical protein IJ062_06235 [Firmicutes bacterium]|nr:hypothetical protein [Bacillota bacterium]
MYDNNKNDFEKFVTLYLAEQDKRNEELRERDNQIRLLRIVNTILTVFLLLSLTATGWLYFNKNGSLFTPNKPEDGIYTSITLSELSSQRKANIAKTKYDCEGKFFNITGNINKINDDLKYITLLNPDDLMDRTTYKFNISSDEVKDAVSGYNSGDRISLNCKCVSVGRFKGFEFDIIELANEESEYKVVPLTQLAEERKTDSNAAKESYLGEKIVTEGQINNIDKNFSYFTMTDKQDNTDKTIFKFYVPTELKEQAIVLSKGQVIRVKCTCTNVGMLQGYDFVLEEIFTDPQDYKEISISELSYAFSTDFAAAQDYKDKFLKFSGKYVSAADDMSYIILKNQENSFDKTEYKIYINNSELFKEAISGYNINNIMTVCVQCRSVNRLKGYEFDLKEIVEE